MSDCPDPFPQSQSSGETLTLVGMAPALYVGELHPDVAESNLFELFSTVGTVTSVRVCKDRDSGRSLGYGYVNYMFEQDAINAIEKLNHNELFGKPIRIMQANRNADTRSSGIGNVFVKNLSESVNDLELEAMFGKFGTILSSKMAIQDGKSKGYGFVQFDSQDSANAAIENLHGTFVDGKQIYVSNFIKKSERILPNPETMYNSLFVKNLDEDITEELIELKFSEFGEVANVKLAKDEAGNSKGYGFVNFENQESAEKAMEAMNGLKLGSKTLFVARAQRKEELQQNLQHTSEHIRFNWDTNLYVKNLDDSVDDSALSEYFSKCGTVISAKVMRDEKGSSKGFGFVCYTTLGEATKALNNLHGNMFHGKPLYVAFAQRNEERQAQLQYHHFQKMAGLVGPGPALSSSGYPPLYYRTPGVVPLIPSQHGLVQHQPFWLRPGWGPSEFVSPTRPIFQPMPLPVNSNIQILDNPRQHSWFPPGQPISYRVQLQQPSHPFISLRGTSGQQSFSARTNYLHNRRQENMNNVPLALSSSHDPQGMRMFSSRLAAAPPMQRRRMLHERLFPLVHQQQPHLAEKITGMLMEMDYSEVLLLLDSPERLAAKVDEVARVLRLS